MTRRNASGFLALALTGALVATLCDANHVYTHTLRYPDPFYLGQAGWVFPGFFLAFTAMALVYAGLAPRCGSTMPVAASQAVGSARAMVEAFAAFVFVYLISGFGNESPNLLAWIFYGTFLVRLAVTYERRWALIVALLLGVGGMLGEGLLSLFGQVTYRHVDVFGVPFWLGALYMHGALALRECMRFFVYRQDTERAS